MGVKNLIKFVLLEGENPFYNDYVMAVREIRLSWDGESPWYFGGETQRGKNRGTSKNVKGLPGGRIPAGTKLKVLKKDGSYGIVEPVGFEIDKPIRLHPNKVDDTSAQRYIDRKEVKRSSRSEESAPASRTSSLMKSLEDMSLKELDAAEKDVLRRLSMLRKQQVALKAQLSLVQQFKELEEELSDSDDDLDDLDLDLPSLSDDDDDDDAQRQADGLQFNIS